MPRYFPGRFPSPWTPRVRSPKKGSPPQSPLDEPLYTTQLERLAESTNQLRMLMNQADPSVIDEETTDFNVPRSTSGRFWKDKAERFDQLRREVEEQHQSTAQMLRDAKESQDTDQRRLESKEKRYARLRDKHTHDKRTIHEIKSRIQQLEHPSGKYEGATIESMGKVVENANEMLQITEREKEQAVMKLGDAQHRVSVLESLLCQRDRELAKAERQLSQCTTQDSVVRQLKRELRDYKITKMELERANTELEGARTRMERLQADLLLATKEVESVRAAERVVKHGQERSLRLQLERISEERDHMKKRLEAAQYDLQKSVVRMDEMDEKGGHHGHGRVKALEAEVAQLQADIKKSANLNLRTQQRMVEERHMNKEQANNVNLDAEMLKKENTLQRDKIQAQKLELDELRKKLEERRGHSLFRPLSTNTQPDVEDKKHGKATESGRSDFGKMRLTEARPKAALERKESRSFQTKENRLLR